ncbi:MAG: hypothetical protein IJX16_06405 [Clostridia bacterium]|nr:hypothetical protein [Clostridia bacterium]
MKNSNQNLLRCISYLALMIVALLLAVEYLLPLIGVELGGIFINVLNTVKNIFIIIVVGVNAFNFVGGKAKWVKWLFWIAIIVIIVATVLMWIR